MDVYKASDRPSKQAGGDYFTGIVWQEPIVQAPDPARVRALRVAFDPGARTNWHTHPLGQTLYVVSGVGRVQKEGEPIIEIRAGDTVWIAPGERHWHGASPTNAMVHIAVQEHLDGKHIEWMEPVSDSDYLG
jgi:quercetin dioxygenase-like cupin family protein